MRQTSSLLKYEVANISSYIPNGKQWAIDALNIPDTWKVTKGRGVTVMVIDTGMSDHADLEKAVDIKLSKNFCKAEDIVDLNGHSTHCCGIVGARGKKEVFGVAPECTIIVVKVMGKSGGGTLEAIDKALAYAKKIKPDVISMSLGYNTNDEDIHNAIKELYKLNIPVIAAAGNDASGNKVCFPAGHKETICVAAYDKDGNHAWFSNQGKRVDFSAPGVSIYSTWLEQQYASLNGTSMATPFIAGIVALLIAKHRKQEKETGFNDCKTVDQIKEHLIKYSDDKGMIGKDNTWGYGIIDPLKMIEDLEKEHSGSSNLAINITLFQKIKRWFAGLLRILKKN